MKAVDPASVQVSVISGNVFLPDSKASPCPSGDSDSDKASPCPSLDSDNDDLADCCSSVKPTPPLSSAFLSTNGSAVRKQDSLGSGDYPTDKEDLVKIPFSKVNQSSVVCDSSDRTRSNTPISKGAFQNGIQNGESPKRVQEKCIGHSRTNGLATNGYCRLDDERRSLESLTDGEGDAEARRSSSPPEDIPLSTGLQADSGLESAASSWDQMREHAVTRLQEELGRARQELMLKDEEVVRLSRIRQEVEAELEDLTASLFQEAHNMVRVANERQAAAEKTLRESKMHVEVLTAEVAALKTLVLTSTPSRPNPHLHPQIDPKAKDESAVGGNALFRKHRRSPSHFNLKYGRENSPPESPVKELPTTLPAEFVEQREGMEVDPVMHREFLAWKQNPTTDRSDPFISRVYREEIDTCLAFSNTELAVEVCSAVESNNIYIEAVNEKSKTHFPKKCALLEAPRQCQYRMRLGEVDTWHSISQICRNRIIAVCDFLNYLKYIQRGLVKSSVHDVYWEIVRLRKEMVLARLGLPLTT